MGLFKVDLGRQIERTLNLEPRRFDQGEEVAGGVADLAGPVLEGQQHPAWGARVVIIILRFFAFFGSGCARAQSSLCALATSSGRARTGVRCSCAVGQTVSSSS